MERFELARILGLNPDRYPEEISAVRVIEAAAHAEFRRTFACAVASGATCFIADPQWREAEKVQLRRCIASASENKQGERERGWLCLPTGGSSGNIRWARHDQNSIDAAVQGFRKHFGVDRINVVGVLPLHHVSGLMGWLRSVMSGGTFVQVDWKRIAAGELPELAPAAEGQFISLVPTQLERLLADSSASDWLRRFRAVLIGGGPSWESLWERAEKARLPLCFSYGATETAAMVCAQQPGDFERGVRDSGRPMPHVNIEIAQDGSVLIKGASVFRGYFPEWRKEGEPWTTGDFGCRNSRGGVEILGRNDDVIITGGKKAAPLEIERALRATGEFSDVAVIGVPDSEWGMKAIAVYPDKGYTLNLTKIKESLAASLAHYKHPKEYIALSIWPRNAQGKLNRAELKRELSNR